MDRRRPSFSFFRARFLMGERTRELDAETVAHFGKAAMIASSPHILLQTAASKALKSSLGVTAPGQSLWPESTLAQRSGCSR
jgi:hypothetical protein